MPTLIRGRAVAAGAVAVVLSSVMGIAAAPGASAAGGSPAPASFAAGSAADGSAKADAPGPPNCTPTLGGGNLCVLNPTAGLAFNATGNSPVTVANNIFWNSSASNAAQASSSGSRVTARAIGGVGGFTTSGGGTFTPTPQTGLAAETDPFANAPEPPPAAPYTTQAEACAAPGRTLTATGSGTTTASPGTYSVLGAKDTATLNLQPGVYTIRGYLKIEGSGTLIGRDVTLYFCSSAGVGVNGGRAFDVSTSRTVTLSAPGGPTDFAVFFARNAAPVSAAIYFAAGQIEITGRVYAASGSLDVAARTQFDSTRPAGMNVTGDVVVNTALIRSGGILNVRAIPTPTIGILLQSAISNAFTNVVSVGEPAHAAVWVLGGSPVGTVEFREYPSLADCTAAVDVFNAGGAPLGGTEVGTPVEVPESLHVVSAALAFDTPGTFYWAAFYSGDAINHTISQAASACTPLDVVAAQSRTS